MNLDEFKNTIREIVRNELMERERKPRPGIGKRISKKKGGARFTSAGTIPTIRGRKLNTQKVSNREEIGKKMLNAFRRGSGVGSELRDKINTQLDSKGLPTDRKHQYSQIWANASDMAAKGATAKDFPRKKKLKKKNEPSGDNQ